MRGVLVFGFLLLSASSSAQAPSRPITEVRVDRPASGEPPPAAPPADPPRAIATPAESAARRLASALAAGDRAGALALALTFDEMSAISEADTSRAAYDREVSDYVDLLIRELAGNTVTDAKTGMQATMPADPREHRKVDVEVAHVWLRVEVNGITRPMTPFMFFKTAAGWRFSIKAP